MNTSRFLARVIWIVGITFILCLNIIGALPRMYKAGGHLVGTNLVSVFEVQSSEHDLIVPLQVWQTNYGRLDTGKRVEVYIRNSYKDDIITYYPRTTLLATGVMLFLQLVIRLPLRGKKIEMKGGSH